MPVIKYQPSKDIVAGRTATQILSAKSKAVGGGRKKCTKGKSCSATCIAKDKVCLVDIPFVAAQPLAKAVKAISAQGGGAGGSAPAQSGQMTPEEKLAFIREVYKDDWTKAWKGMNLAIADGDKQMHDSWLKKITEQHAKITAKGYDVGPLKVQKWPKSPVTISEKARAKLLEAKKLTDIFVQNPNAVVWSDVKTKSDLKMALALVKDFKAIVPEGTDMATLGRAVKIFAKVYEGTGGDQYKIKENYEKLVSKFVPGFKVPSTARPQATAPTPTPAPRSGTSPTNTPTNSALSSKFEGIKISKFQTTEDFVNLMDKNSLYEDKKMKKINNVMEYVYTGGSSQMNQIGKGANALRENMLKKFGGVNSGQDNLDVALKAVRSFTGSYYDEIRSVQQGKSVSSYRDPEYKQMGKDIEKLISASPKPRMEKFRGIAVEPNDLAAIVRTSQQKGVYVEPALASWSSSTGVSKIFADSNANTYKTERVIFRTVNKRGAAVESITANTGENELLTPSKTKYVHTGNYRVITKGYHTYHVFDMVEQ